MVRQGPNRSKADFDRLAKRIEDAWYEVVNGSGSEGADSKDSEEDRKAKNLHLVVFYPMIAAREAGTTIPGVSQVLFSAVDASPLFNGLRVPISYLSPLSCSVATGMYDLLTNVLDCRRVKNQLGSKTTCHISKARRLTMAMTILKVCSRRLNAEMI